MKKIYIIGMLILLVCAVLVTADLGGIGDGGNDGGAGDDENSDVDEPNPDCKMHKWKDKVLGTDKKIC